MTTPKRPSDPDDRDDKADEKHLKDGPHPEHPIADIGAPHPDHPIAGPGRGRPKATPLTEGPDTTRVLLTGDDRSAVTERYIATTAYGFRILVDGQHFEQVAKATDSDTMIFAPTR